MKLSDNLLAKLISSENTDAAWQCLCNTRQKFPPNADIWHLRFHRDKALSHIIVELQSGHYRFSPMQVITKADGE